MWFNMLGLGAWFLSKKFQTFWQYDRWLILSGGQLGWQPTYGSCWIIIARWELVTFVLLLATSFPSSLAVIDYISILEFQTARGFYFSTAYPESFNAPPCLIFSAAFGLLSGSALLILDHSCSLAILSQWAFPVWIHISHAIRTVYVKLQIFVSLSTIFRVCQEGCSRCRQ